MKKPNPTSYLVVILVSMLFACDKPPDTSESELLQDTSDAIGGLDRMWDVLYTDIHSQYRVGNCNQRELAYALATSAIEAMEEIVFIGESKAGRLTSSDAILDGDGTYYDTWVLYVCESTNVVIDMISDDIDAYMLLSHWYTLRLDEIREIASDDDSGRRLNARITARLEPGVYGINTNTVSRETGTYELTIRETEPTMRETLNKSDRTALMGIPLPEGAELTNNVQGNNMEQTDPSETYSLSATAEQIEMFYKRVMPDYGWAGDGSSGLFYGFVKGNRVVGVWVKPNGGEFTLIGS